MIFFSYLVFFITILQCYSRSSHARLYVRTFNNSARIPRDFKSFGKYFSYSVVLDPVQEQHHNLTIRDGCGQFSECRYGYDILQGSTLHSRQGYTHI
jgi:hypothetical protein